MNLENAKVLLISPKFFGYESVIISALERKGATVEWHNHIPSTRPIIKAINRLMPVLLGFWNRRYFDGILTKRIDYFTHVIVIKGEGVSIQTVKLIRATSPNAKLIYYTWDSLRNFGRAEELAGFFDRGFSFDGIDCQKTSLFTHCPLFFHPLYEQVYAESKTWSVENYKYDILFLGSVHSDRYNVAQSIAASARAVTPALRLNMIFFHPSRWVFELRRIWDGQFRRIKSEDVLWKPLAFDEVRSEIGASRILIDIHHPGQTGLTMRTLESVGAGRKLITTNPEVAKYPFYDPHNIAIIDRKWPKVGAEFLQSCYRPLDQDIYSAYTVSAWIDRILG